MEIKNRYTGEIIFSGDYKTMRECVEDAARKRVILRSAYLPDINLSYANLTGVNLSDAYLICTNLIEANLNNAVLIGADLRWSCLISSNLDKSDLRGACLSGAVGAIQWQSPRRLKRICVSVLHGDNVMHKIGCFWGDTDEAAAAIIKKYGENSLYEKIMRLNAEALK